MAKQSCPLQKESISVNANDRYGYFYYNKIRSSFRDVRFKHKYVITQENVSVNDRFPSVIEGKIANGRVIHISNHRRD